MHGQHQPRKVPAIAIAAVFVVVGLATLATPASSTHETNANGVGNHLFKLNIIGRPNDYSGDGGDSSGRALFISLDSENKQKSNGQDFVCEDASFYEEEPADNEPFYELADNKERIRFTAGDDFTMVDRDATDGWAEIEVPAGVGDMHVAVRVLGKPGGCADFDGIAEDTCLDDAGNEVDCFWWTGTIHANRKTGTPDKIAVTEIFDVTGDFNGDGVITDGSGGTPDETDISVFSEEFDGYFWEVTNDGLKLMQVIFYEA